MAEPLSGEELERVRDGSAVPEPEPCSACGAVPRRWADGLLHFIHEPGCSWAQELGRRLGEEAE